MSGHKQLENFAVIRTSTMFGYESLHRVLLQVTREEAEYYVEKSNQLAKPIHGIDENGEMCFHGNEYEDTLVVPMILLGNTMLQNDIAAFTELKNS